METLKLGWCQLVWVQWQSLKAWVQWHNLLHESKRLAVYGRTAPGDFLGELGDEGLVTRRPAVAKPYRRILWICGFGPRLRCLCADRALSLFAVIAAIQFQREHNLIGMVVNKQGIFAGFAGNGVVDVQVLLWP